MLQPASHLRGHWLFIPAPGGGGGDGWEGLVRGAQQLSLCRHTLRPVRGAAARLKAGPARAPALRWHTASAAFPPSSSSSPQRAASGLQTGSLSVVCDSAVGGVQVFPRRIHRPAGFWVGRQGSLVSRGCMERHLMQRREISWTFRSAHSCIVVNSYWWQKGWNAPEQCLASFVTLTK